MLYGRSLYWYIAGVLVGGLTVHHCDRAQAEELLETDRVSMVVSRFGCNRDSMTPQYDGTCSDYVGRVSSEMNFRLLGAGYWNNTVHTEGVAAQVTTVGWQFEAGVHLAPELDLFYSHHSRHVMDAQQPEYYDRERDQYYRGKFPVEDSWGIRLNFYVNHNPSRSLIGD